MWKQEQGKTDGEAVGTSDDANEGVVLEFIAKAKAFK